MTKRMVWLLAVGACLSLPASAREVFRAADENGVVSFSDVASPGAEVIEVVSEPVPDAWIDRQQRIIEQQLAVARVLEDARLAREEARTRRLVALSAARSAVAQPAPVPRTYLGGVGNWLAYARPLRRGHPWKAGHPGWGSHPGQPMKPSPGGRGRLDPPSRPVPLLPLEPR